MSRIEFTPEETALLVVDGYQPAWMGDVKAGDLVAVPPVTRFSFDADNEKRVATYRITRVVTLDASYWDEESEKVKQHFVVNLIGFDLDNLPVHLSYGCTYPCFFKRDES